MDTTAPTYSSATVDGATLKITFSENLKTTSTPAASRFTANVGGTARTVSSYTLAGKVATLTLASPVVQNEAVTIAYTKPNAAPFIEDVTGNDLATFTAKTVTNTTITATEIGAISLARAAANRVTVTIATAHATNGNTFADMGWVLVSSATACTPANYTAATPKHAYKPSGTTISGFITGNAGKFVCVRAQTAGTDTAAYYKASSVIAYPGPTLAINSAGNDGAYIAGDHIEVTADFGYKVHVTGTPRIGIQIGTNERYATYQRGTGAGQIVFRYTVVAADSDDNGISIGANALQNVTGSSMLDDHEAAAVLTHAAVAADATRKVVNTAPTVTSALLKRKILAIEFSEALDEASKPAASRFAVAVGTGTGTVNSYAIHGKWVELTLAAEPDDDDTVTVSYTKPTSGSVLQSAAGVDVASFSDEDVTNNNDANDEWTAHTPGRSRAPAAPPTQLSLNTTDNNGERSSNYGFVPSVASDCDDATGEV